MLNIVAMYSISLRLPQIIKAAGQLSEFETSLVTALPFMCTTVAMMIHGQPLQQLVL